MRGMGAQAVLLGIVLCVEDDSTSESSEPKNEGKQNAFVLLPSGHGGSRTHLSTATPFSQQSGGIFPESCPLILFRITGRRIKPRADRRPLLTRSQRFRGRTSPDCQRKTEELLLQFTLLCRTGIIAHATRLFRSTIVHLALLWGCVTPLHRLGSPPVGTCRTVLKKEAHEVFTPSPPKYRL